jgi:hypothetical protein
MSIVSTKVVTKVSKKITKEVVLADGTTLKFVKKIKTKKTKTTYCFPQGIWELIKDFADMQTKYVDMMCGEMSISVVDALFVQPQRCPPELAKVLKDIISHDDYEGQTIQYQKIMYSNCPKQAPTSNLWTFIVPEMCGNNFTFKYTFDTYANKLYATVNGAKKIIELEDDIVRTPVASYIENNLSLLQKKNYRKKILCKQSCGCFLCFQKFLSNK